MACQSDVQNVARLTNLEEVRFLGPVFKRHYHASGACPQGCAESVRLENLRIPRQHWQS